jgi:hypothetical protein
VLPDAFHVARDAASYMPSNNRRHDPYVTSAQWSRRFLGLRLFLSLAAGGWRAIADHVENATGLIDKLKASLAADGWTIANNSPMAVLCVTPPPGSPSPHAIAGSVVASGQAWITDTNFLGREVLRICVTNGRTTVGDIEFLAGLLRDAAGRDRVTPQATMLEQHDERN